VQCRLTAAKFLAVVRPGDKLTLEHTATEDSKVRFVIRAANSIVASGMLSHGA
jgi:3-hydroxymyristoyl/3-hydroxydecanoyl-(acyl carrier protein) dehydratase